MSNVLIEESCMYDIADAIRTQMGEGVTTTFLPSVMAETILDLKVGGLEYESGTQVPSSTTTGTTVAFKNTHTSKPWIVYLQYTGASPSNNECAYYCQFHPPYLFGDVLKKTDRGFYIAGRYNVSGSTISVVGMEGEALTSSNGLKNTGFTPKTSYTYVSGHIYKWIAIWPPT